MMGEEIKKVQNDHDLPNEKVTNIVTDGGTGICTSFKKYGKGHDILVEEIRGETIEEAQLNLDLSAELENGYTYMQNENGELFHSNIITLTNNSDELSVDDIDDSQQTEETDQFSDEDPTELIQMNDFVETDFVLPPQRRCVSHLLNLVAGDFDSPQQQMGNAKSAFVTAYSKLQGLWNYTHRSSMAKTICKEVIGCCLQVPVVTRWNSKFDAVAKCCQPEIKSKVNYLVQRLATELNATHLQILTNFDWIVLSDYLSVMKPVATSLDKLQGEQTASQGFIILTLIAMRYRVANLEGGNILQQFKKNDAGNNSQKIRSLF